MITFVMVVTVNSPKHIFSVSVSMAVLGNYFHVLLVRFQHKGRMADGGHNRPENECGYQR